MLLPFGTSSIMNNSNAMAIGEDYDYEADQYKNYAMDMANDNYYKSQNSDFIQKIKCNNINANVNGFNGIKLGTLPTSDLGALAIDEAQADEDGRGGYDGRSSGHDSNSRVVCINNNNNTNVINGETPVPPTPPTGSITVNKEIFGCNTLIGNTMNCEELQNDSPLWLPCTDPTISTTPFCQNISPNVFDIEVLGEIQQFEGSTAGTTIQNLQTDTFRVNEIVHDVFSNNQLTRSTADQFCKARGFAGGGSLFNEDSGTNYPAICFQYTDEQGNDCNPITVGAGEEKTCTVKNHIAFAQDF